MKITKEVRVRDVKVGDQINKTMSYNGDLMVYEISITPKGKIMFYGRHGNVIGSCGFPPEQWIRITVDDPNFVPVGYDI
jgi:hypothetical protein